MRSERKSYLVVTRSFLGIPYWISELGIGEGNKLQIRRRRAPETLHTIVAVDPLRIKVRDYETPGLGFAPTRAGPPKKDEDLIGDDINRDGKGTKIKNLFRSYTVRTDSGFEAKYPKIYRVYRRIKPL